MGAFFSLNRSTLVLALPLVAAVASGCSTASGGLGQAADVSGMAVQPALTVVTTRSPVRDARAKPWFGQERARHASVARVRFASPYEGGPFSLAAVGLGAWRIDSVESMPQGLRAAARGGRRDILIYVHGFNQSFETAALDAARLSDGIKFRGETMLFSWPSKENVLDYIYDRESALWSRDALENMLNELLNDPSVGTVNIVAHSMGTMLTVEGLRQIHARYGEQVTGRIGAVVLAAPDIDIDGFSSSVARIGGLTRHITVLTAATDRALSVMQKMAGGVTRVGAAEKPRLEALGLRVIDASAHGFGFINHDLFLSNAQVRDLVRHAIDQRVAPAIAGGAPGIQ